MRGTWEDPPEYRGGGAGMRVPALTPVVKKLLWINGIVFLATYLLARWSPAALDGFFRVFTLNPEVWVAWFPFPPVWQFLSYGFLHDVGSPFHLLYNLLALYFFGTMLEGIIGGRRFLVSYLAAIALGGAAQLAFMLVLSIWWPEMVAGTLGASGGVLFVIVACATLRPNTQVIFILFPLRLKTLALIMVGIDLFGLITPGYRGTAHLVHLTGAALGFLAVRLRWIWIDPVQLAAERREVRREQGEQEDTHRLDALLKQIHEKGIHTLSRRDREFLKRVSSRK